MDSVKGQNQEKGKDKYNFEIEPLERSLFALQGDRPGIKRMKSSPEKSATHSPLDEKRRCKSSFDLTVPSTDFANKATDEVSTAEDPQQSHPNRRRCKSSFDLTVPPTDFANKVKRFATDEVSTAEDPQQSNPNRTTTDALTYFRQKPERTLSCESRCVHTALMKKRRSSSCDGRINAEKQSKWFREIVKKPEFSNWVKCVLALNKSKEALKVIVKEKFKNFIKMFREEDFVVFFKCLNDNNVKSIKSNTNKRQKCTWECSHKSCETIFTKVLEEHIPNQAGKWSFKETSGPSTGLAEDQKSSPSPSEFEATEASSDAVSALGICDRYWRVAQLYIYTDSQQKENACDTLESIDISNMIKLMRSCKHFKFDGSAEIYDGIIEKRNKLMHSPDNMATKEDMTETFNMLYELFRQFQGCQNTLKELMKFENEDLMVQVGSFDFNKYHKIEEDACIALRLKDEALEAELQMSKEEIQHLSKLHEKTNDTLRSIERNYSFDETNSTTTQFRDYRTNIMKENETQTEYGNQIQNIHNPELVVLQEVNDELNSKCIQMQHKETNTEDLASLVMPSTEKQLVQSFEGDVWAKALESGDQLPVMLALKDGMLPNQTELDSIANNFGRRSDLVSDICEKICRSIRSSNENIINVWPAYRCSGNNKGTIYFIVMVKEDIDLRRANDNGYNIVLKTLGHVSNEGKEVIYSNLFESCLSEMSCKEIERLKGIIDQNNVKLLQKHSNLTIISASPVRSRGYGEKHEILKEHCIVLYVLIKGFAPLHEEPFQSEYEGIPVDVREGLTTCFGARDYQETLLNGCEIARYHSGTLGGFICHPEYGTCGITCAHVLLIPSEFNKFNSHNTVQDWSDPHRDTLVYQPSQVANTSCGHLVRAIYREGGGGESGLDIAIFQIEERYPDSGQFPLLKDGSFTNMCFDSGKTAGVTRLRSCSSVIKFGKTTEKTHGSIIFNVPLTSARTLELQLYENQPKIKVHNLLEIKAESFTTESQHSCFASVGDSGALVFCKGEAEQLFCIGVVMGGTSAGTCLIMPIVPILQQLHVSGLKTFENNKLEHKIDIGFCKHDNKIKDLEEKVNKIDQKIETGLRELNSKIDRLLTR